MVASKGTAVMQFGGNSAIAEHTGKFMGICSGIDLDISNSELACCLDHIGASVW